MYPEHQRQGFETTSHAIAWTLGLLAAHPEKQALLAAELAAAGLAPAPGGDGGGGGDEPPRAFAWGDLAAGRLPYLAAVVRESLRLFPPVRVLFKLAHREREGGWRGGGAGEIAKCINANTTPQQTNKTPPSSFHAHRPPAAACASSAPT